MFFTCALIRHVDRPCHVAWLAALLLGTLYSYTWDIVMDWALVEVDFDGGKRALPRIRQVTN